MRCRAPGSGTGLWAGPGLPRVTGPGSLAAAAAVAAADVIVCATSASEPLFDSSLVRDDAVVMAVGSHEPHVREVDAALFARAQVIVEDVPTACANAAT